MGWELTGIILFGAGSLAALAAAYLFHLAFEKPFLRRRDRQRVVFARSGVAV
jgi:peptidoglycan/LPS O-acetylase OafA/YrhL